MRTEEFTSILGNIKEEYIQDAHAPRRSIGQGWQRWCAAACLCLAALGTVYFTGKSAPPMDPGVDAPAVTVISQYQTDNAPLYKTPDPGEYFFFAAVDEARKQYAGQDVKFLLAMDVFNTDGVVAVTDMGGEFKRLTELGYDIKLTYLEETNGDVVHYWPLVVGLFTEEQLVAFPADPGYGYTFRFAANPDGSPLSEKQMGRITGYSAPVE